MLCVRAHPDAQKRGLGRDGQCVKGSPHPAQMAVAFPFAPAWFLCAMRQDDEQKRVVLLFQCW